MCVQRLLGIQFVRRLQLTRKEKVSERESVCVLGGGSRGGEWGGPGRACAPLQTFLSVTLPGSSKPAGDLWRNPVEKGRASTSTMRPAMRIEVRGSLKISRIPRFWQGRF